MNKNFIVQSRSLPDSLRHEHPEDALQEALALVDFLEEVALSMTDSDVNIVKTAPGLALTVQLLRDKLSIAAGIPFPLASDDAEAPTLQALLLAGTNALQKSGKGAQDE